VTATQLHIAKNRNKKRATALLISTVAPNSTLADIRHSADISSAFHLNQHTID
jgi:hypothetical protein